MYLLNEWEQGPKGGRLQTSKVTTKIGSMPKRLQFSFKGYEPLYSGIWHLDENEWLKDALVEKEKHSQLRNVQAVHRWETNLAVAKKGKYTSRGQGTVIVERWTLDVDVNILTLGAERWGILLKCWEWALLKTLGVVHSWLTFEWREERSRYQWPAVSENILFRVSQCDWLLPDEQRHITAMGKITMFSH